MYSSAFLQAIVDVCKGYETKKCYAGVIPNKIEARVREKFNVPANQGLLAFIDFTIFSYAKDGMAIAENGIYWREYGAVSFIRWSTLADLENIRVDHNIRLGDSEFSKNGCPLPGEKLLALLTELADTARAYAAEGGISAAERGGSGDETLEQAIVRICASFARNKTYVHPIPRDIEAKLRKKNRLGPDETVLSFFNYALFGKSGEGVLFTNKGVRWNDARNYLLAWEYVRPAADADEGASQTLLALLHQEFTRHLSPLKWIEWRDLLAQVDALPQLAARRQKAAELENAAVDEALRYLLLPYNGCEFYRAPLPEDVEQQARARYRVPDGLAIWAYIDIITYHPGKYGALLTQAGLHWNSPGASVFLPWDEFLRADIAVKHASPKNMLVLGSGQELSLEESTLPPEQWIELLERLRSLPQLGRLKERELVEPHLDDSHPEFDDMFIEAICRSHSFFDKLSSYSAVGDKEAAVRISFRLAPSERIVAFRDDSPGQDGKYGLLVTGRSVYVRLPMDSRTVRESVLPLSGLEGADFLVEGQSLYHGNELVYRGGGARELLVLMNDLKLYVASLEAAGNPVVYPYDAAYAEPWNLPVPPTDDTRWIVAEGGMLRGIHTAAELAWAAGRGLLDPERTRFWRRGLAEWISAETAGLGGQESL